MSMKVSVVGLGKLGLCTAVCCAHAGIETWGVDIRRDYLDILGKGEIPFHERDLERLFMESRECLHLTDNLETAVEATDISMIIVPTPSRENGAFSSDGVMNVIKSMAPALKRKQSFHVVDVVSTVMPGSSENYFKPLLEQTTGKKVGTRIGLAYNPEFIAIGSVIGDFMNPDLVLVGESDTDTGEKLKALYERVCTNSPQIYRTSLINAEIAKLCINCYCTMKISFANNLDALCDHIPNADAGEVLSIVGRDSRIGLKYIKPGLGFGGPCFPRDNEAFIRFIKETGGYSGLQEAVIAINRQQVERATVKIVNAALDSGNRVALLGLSYKPGTYLTECSQALEIARIIGNSYPGIELRVFDPMVKEEGPYIQAGNLLECVKGANVAAILTPWPEFMTPEEWVPLMADGAKVIDLWRCDRFQQQPSVPMDFAPDMECPNA